MLGCARPNYQEMNNDAQVLATPPCEIAFAEKKCSLYLATEKICTDIEWKQFQEGKQKGSFFICSYDQASGVPVNMSHQPFVELWMPSMNHGSSPTKIDNPLSVGVYPVTNVYFIMSGDWEIRIQIKNQTGLQDQATQKITVEKK